jgi:hypothetical protein
MPRESGLITVGERNVLPTFIGRKQTIPAQSLAFRQSQEEKEGKKKARLFGRAKSISLEENRGDRSIMLRRGSGCNSNVVILDIGMPYISK